MSRARDFADLAGSADAGGLTGRNLVINGAMQVAQRGTSSTGQTSSGYKNSPDRFRQSIGTAGTWTVSQSTDAPEGFSNSHKLDCTTANSSLSAASDMVLQHRLEGQNLQMLKKGTSNAESVTVSFYVKSNKTGTYIFEMFDNDNSRSISKAYTISSADTWERKEITIEGDTTGTLDNDNARSVTLQWWLVAGSNFTSGTLSTSWTASSGNTANRVVGQVNLADSTSNEWYITGVQMELGEQATPFEHRSYADELARCQRYYYRVGDDNNGGVYFRYGVGSCQGSSSCGVVLHAPVKMRTTPTLEQTGTASNYGLYEADSVHACSSVPSLNSAHCSPSNFNVTFTSSGNLASGNAAEALNNNNTTSYLAFAAEL